MNVGLPGTGVGGLFYLLLAVLMPLHELWRTTIAGAILAALWVEGWLLQKGIHWASAQHGLGGAFPHVAGEALLGNHQLIAFASLLTLACLLLLVHAFGTIVSLSTAQVQESRSPIAPVRMPPASHFPGQ